MKAKWNIWLALVAVFALAAAACGDDDSASSSGPIRIGVLNPTTSFLATLGLDGNEAIEYYFNTEVGGEIAGRPIELIFEDTAADPVLALTKAQKLIERDNVDIILGPLDTPEGLAVRDYIQGQGVPWVLHVGAGWAPDDLTQRGDYSFMVAPTNPQQHFAMAEYAYDVLGYRNMIVTALDYAPGHEIAAGFKEAFEAKGGTIVDTVLIPLGAADTAPYITQILDQADEADAVNAAPIPSSKTARRTQTAPPRGRASMATRTRLRSIAAPTGETGPPSSPGQSRTTLPSARRPAASFLASGSVVTPPAPKAER